MKKKHPKKLHRNKKRLKHQKFEADIGREIFKVIVPGFMGALLGSLFSAAMEQSNEKTTQIDGDWQEPEIIK